MKKIILAVAFIAGIGLFTEAKAQQGNETTVTIEASTSQDNEFTDVKIEDLNENVQATINGFSEEYTVKALAYNTDKKVTKVTLESKEDQSEKIVLLNDEGKEEEEAKEEQL